MLRVVIIGYGEMLMNLIAGTLDADCNIVGVFRKENAKLNPIVRYLKNMINPSVEYNYVKSYKLHEISAKGVNTAKFKKELLSLNPDIILVGSWFEKISKEVYDIPKIATINAHPSLLPKYRGPNPYFWTIRNRELSSGISFHLVDEGFDTGAILAQEEVKIYPSDTGKSLKERTVLAARGVVCELLKDLSEDVIIPLTQIEEKSTYYSHPENLQLDFNNSAEDNDALIRAIIPWSEAYFSYKDNILSVTHSEILSNDTDWKGVGTVVETDSTARKVSVLCGNNKILRMTVHIYNNYDKILSSNYIRREVKIGSQIL